MVQSSQLFFLYKVFSYFKYFSFSLLTASKITFKIYTYSVQRIDLVLYNLAKRVNSNATLGMLKPVVIVCDRLL